MRDVASLLRAGEVPRLSVKAQGKSLSDLMRLEAFRIAGRIENGLVRILALGIDLEDASGDVTIEGGVLSASGVVARVGSSSFREATARVGLTDADQTLSIECRDAHFALAEVYARAEAEGWLPEALRGLSGVGGNADLSQLSIGGSRTNPGAVVVRAEGAAHDVRMGAAPWSGDASLRSALSLPELELAREEGRISVSGRADAAGAAAEFEIVSTPERFALSRLRLRDAHSDATLRWIAADDVELAFSGNLLKDTLDALLTTNPLLAGSVRGDFSARLVPAAPLRSTATGNLQATELTIPGGLQLHLAQLTLQADARRFVFEADADSPAIGKAKLAGTVQATDEALITDATLRAGDVDLAAFFDARSAGEPQTASASALSRWRGFLRGKVDVQLDSLRYGDRHWKPFRAEVALAPGDPVVNVREARTCGVGTTGTAVFTPAGVEAHVVLAADNEPVEQAISCLTGRAHAMTGVGDLEARLRGKGEASAMASVLAGRVRFEARKGRIHEMPIIAKTLMTLNLATGGFKNVADLHREGLPYDRISLRGELRRGKIHLTEGVLEGPSVKITGQGVVDVLGNDSDLTLMVAPLRTVDSVVDKVPVVGSALGGSLVAIPVRVKGRIGEPTVTPLDPSVVGGELKGLMERTLKLPGRALRPLIPGRRSK